MQIHKLIAPLALVMLLGPVRVSFADQAILDQFAGPATAGEEPWPQHSAPGLPRVPPASLADSVRISRDLEAMTLRIAQENASRRRQGYLWSVAVVLAMCGLRLLLRIAAGMTSSLPRQGKSEPARRS